MPKALIERFAGRQPPAGPPRGPGAAAPQGRKLQENASCSFLRCLPLSAYPQVASEGVGRMGMGAT
eukprot:1156006-Alexandrium_andersonii.AAC.1